MSWQSPIFMSYTDHIIEEAKKAQEDIVLKAVIGVGVHVDKKELIRALSYDREQYEKGQWDMFERITFVYHGKQYYFLQDDGRVYSRESGKIMTVDEAYDEFIEKTGWGM